MKLTKDDFYGVHSSYCSVGIQLKHNDITDEQLIEQILKNQEIADFYTHLTSEYEDGLTPELFKEWKEDAESLKQLQKFDHSTLLTQQYIKNEQIVERLKKRLEELMDAELLDEIHCKLELQKILDGEK